MKIEQTTFDFIVYTWIAIGIVIFPLVLWVVAPYGRHTTSRWGPLINNKIGWILMESPSLFLFSWFFLSGNAQISFIPWVFFLAWFVHYFNRTLIFPFRLRTKGKKMPFTIVLMAFSFNLVNAFINGYYLGNLSAWYDSAWLLDPRFIFGAFLFLMGLIINWHSDNILIHLRKPGETGYVIPQGGLFKYISCPNHFSEIIEWTGYALMTWCLPGLAFAIWTFVNLVPRALHHHRWYGQTFPDYPANRKALFPFLL